MGVTYEVRIDGQAIPLADHQWTLVMGIAAPIQAWEAPAAVVDEIVSKKAGKEVTLQLDELEVERVIVLGNAPAGDPQRQLLLLTDVRWYWTRAWFAMNVNVRRRIGDTRLLGNGNTPVEATPAVQDVQFAGFSINALEPWLWDALARAVMATATAPKNGRPAITWTMDSSVTNIDAKIVEETVTDSQMPTGIARAIAAVPGRDLYVDVKGTVHVCDKSPGAEKPLIDPLLGYELWGHGSMKWCNLAALRAKTWRIKFTREHDVRCVKAITTVDGARSPYLENVLPCPDASLEIPSVAGRAARTVGRGTWITFDEAYAAWGAPDSDTPSLSDDVVRSAYLGGWLWPNYVTRFLPEDDPVWARRINAVMEHYRKTFRVNPQFWGGVLSARAVTSAVWDEETGTRAPSPVFCDFATKPTIRALAAGSTKAGGNTTNTFPTGDASVNAAKPAPANVEILDEEQGIISIVWKVPTRASAVAPSALEDVPDVDPESEPLFRTLAWATRHLVSENTYKLATILSLVPAAPNSADRFYEVEVPIAEALAALGRTETDLEAKGPDQEDRTEITTARFAWSDSSDDAARILGIFKGETTSISATDDSLTPQSLVPINKELELVPVARAVAAADLFRRLDHYEGRLAVPLAGGAAPIGSVTSVTHRVTKDMAQTIINATPPATPLNAIDLLNTSVRKRLGRDIQP